MNSNRLNRRKWLLHTSCILLGDHLATSAFGASRSTKRLLDAAAKGRKFLASVFDPTLSLLPEFRGSSVYWLFHDNYLAAKVLDRSHPEMATKIVNAIHSYGVKESGKIEIIFGEAEHPLPFRQYRLTEVRRVGKKIVRTEVVTDTEMGGWEAYADLLLLAAIALAEEKPAQAKEHFQTVMQMWDGKGLKDRVVEAHNQYATYKLALALIAAKKLDRWSTPCDTILERMLAQQAEDGGWITDYTINGKPVGKANVETTSLAILALDAIASPTGRK